SSSLWASAFSNQPAPSLHDPSTNQNPCSDDASSTPSSGWDSSAQERAARRSGLFSLAANRQSVLPPSHQLSPLERSHSTWYAPWRRRSSSSSLESASRARANSRIVWSMKTRPASVRRSRLLSKRDANSSTSSPQTSSAASSSNSPAKTARDAKLRCSRASSRS